MLYVDMGRLDDALDIYEKSNAIFSSLKIIRGEALIKLEKGKILYLRDDYAKADVELAGATEVLEQIGDLPYYAQSMILHSKIKRQLGDLENALIFIKKALDTANTINSSDLINESLAEKEIIHMHKSENSDALLALSVKKDAGFNEDIIAYIHFYLWKYAQIESSKISALKLYKDLYDKFPKYSYKLNIDKLS